MNDTQSIKSEIAVLYDKYLRNEIDRGEFDRLHDLLLLNEADTGIDVLMDVSWHTIQPISADVQNESVKAKPVRHIYVLPRWTWAAAVVLLLLGASIYFWTSSKKNTQQTSTSMPLADVPAGKDGAILTLADGRKIVLDSLGNGIIATQGGTKLMLNNGQLAYNPDNNTKGETIYNTMSTPNGRQFNVVLPDGTKVWLNSASSLKYPTQFNKAERRVEITGEAYFEIAKDASKPFKVSGGGQEIEVLGTSFNINVYADEPVKKTTLITGSIKITHNNQTAILKPGQQANISISEITKIKQITVQTDNVIAWKRGAFSFDGASLEEVMRQLARWYNLEIVYAKNIPAIKFGGKMSRNVKLASVLQALKESKVNFRMEGNRKLIVMP